MCRDIKKPPKVSPSIFLLDLELQYVGVSPSSFVCALYFLCDLLGVLELLGISVFSSIGGNDNINTTYITELL